MKRIETALEIIEKNQKDASNEWRELEANVFNEEFEDTLQRKYTEGYADALQSVLELFAELNLQEIQKDIATNSAQDVLVWLEEVYGSGIHETGAWQTYMDSIESN